MTMTDQGVKVDKQSSMQDMITASSSAITSAYIPPELRDQMTMRRPSKPKLNKKPSATIPNEKVVAENAATIHDASAQCGCGCIPKIKSLFEMAELRKQARLKKQNAKKMETTNM